MSESFRKIVHVKAFYDSLYDIVNLAIEWKFIARLNILNKWGHVS